MADDALRPWDRRPSETPQAFEAFALYRDMGQGRTIERVARILDKHHTNVAKWSARHDWVARAAAFDAVAERRAADGVLEEEVAVRIRQAEAARVFQQRAVQRFASLDPDTMSARDAILAFRVGASEERKALGIADKVELGGPIQTQEVPFDWVRALGSRPSADEGLSIDGERG